MTSQHLGNEESLYHFLRAKNDPTRGEPRGNLSHQMHEEVEGIEDDKRAQHGTLSTKNHPTALALKTSKHDPIALGTQSIHRCRSAVALKTSKRTLSTKRLRM